jgi:hypothetical protein
MPGRGWDSLSWDEKKLFIKQADVYGAYLAYTDHDRAFDL